jgi:hypothetical protein
LALLPLAVPCGLLIVGGAIGYPFTLDVPVARERLVGLLATTGLAILAMLGMSRMTRPARLLVALSVLACIGDVWVVAATGPDAFRGIVGSLLQRIFQPVFGLVRLTDPVELTNTRFIVGYNGLADLCLVTIFCCGALVLARPRTRGVWLLLAAIGVSLILLVGTGARGGLTGLAAGICMVALFAWPRRYALLALLAAPVLIAAAAVGILDKGLEFGSTAGRLTYWLDLVRLLAEYPLTGVGLGLDTANRIALQ